MSADAKLNILLVGGKYSELFSQPVVPSESDENLLKVSSAAQAFEMLLEHEVALILIDVGVPDLDGFELAAMIRKNPRFQNTFVIFISADIMTTADQLRGYELGGADFIAVTGMPELIRAKVKVFVDLYRKTREVERFNAELEQRVAERTAQLRRFDEELGQRIEERTRERETALAQLFEAQKMDTIGQLTGGVAHDFNNLLMAVLGSLTLLEKRLPADDQLNRRLLQNAVQGAQRGAALTQRLLAFSRRQELRPESVDVVDLVSRMEDLLKRALGLGIELKLDFASALPPVLADVNQLELALLNLALNARDAMHAGGQLTIGALAESKVANGSEQPLPTGEYVRISIADTGVGMDDATLAKAAEPFFTTKGPGKGTGLGLSMVHGLAAQSGGSLRIRSQAARGTTIELYLPRANTAAVTVTRDPHAVESSPITEPCRVLLVDDDYLVMTGTSAMIEDLGHTAVEAHSAAEALAKLAAGVKIDVVITDHAMPAMTGLQLASCIQERYPGLPIILATGFAELPTDPTKMGLLKLTKPCSQHDIATAIHVALRTRRPPTLPVGQMMVAAR